MDLPGEQVRFVKTKRHRARAVPVVGEALTILTALAQHRRSDVPWVFPSWRGKEPVAIDSAWETARNHAQIEDFHFHDLRLRIPRMPATRSMGRWFRAAFDNITFWNID